MAANIALKRTKKARQRQRAVAQRRKLERVEATLGSRIRRAAAGSLRHCLFHGNPHDGGITNVVVAREMSSFGLGVAFFLVDAYCLGIKEVLYDEFGAEEFGAYALAMSQSAPLTPVEPSHARKFVREAAAWAASIGFAPHRNFVAVEQIFGDVDADACDATFVFGKDGKPFYIAGPTETRARIRKRLTHLQDRFGEDGFEHVIGV